jgi:hypothetical protein
VVSRDQCIEEVGGVGGAGKGWRRR